MKAKLIFGTGIVATTLLAVAIVAQQSSSEQHRDVAMGLMIGHTVPEASIDRGLEVAEALRRRYRIDSGKVIEDREAAAKRAKTELLAKLTFGDQALREAAIRLGHDPD